MARSERELHMWPFSNKPRFPGVEQNSDGTINFSLTDDEAREADRALQMFKGLVVHQDAAEKVRNGTIAVALSRYASGLVTLECNPESEAERKANWPAIKQTLEKAVASVWKSYSLYPLPIFLYHRASFLHMLGEKDQARPLYEAFIKEQAAFKPDQIDKVLIDYDQTNIESAVSHAKQAFST